MVSLRNYYDKVTVSEIPSTNPLGIRIRQLLDEVILRLPDEEQFGMKGHIFIGLRTAAIGFWQIINTQRGSATDMNLSSKDGNCTFWFSKNLEDSTFGITIIVDNLNEKSDDYIRGLIAHEISELSYAWKVNDKISNSKKLGRKAPQIMFNQLTKQDAPIGSPEHEEHEKNVNEEAKRLGFSKEILTLDG